MKSPTMSDCTKKGCLYAKKKIGTSYCRSPISYGNKKIAKKSKPIKVGFSSMIHELD